MDTKPTDPFPYRASPDVPVPPAPPMPAPPAAVPMEAGSFGLAAPPPDGYRPIQEARSPARTPLIVAGVVGAVLVLMATATFVLHRGDGLPGSIGGIPRMHSADAKNFENTVSGMHVGDVHIHGAMYGTGDIPELIVERFDGVPATELQGSSSVFFDQAARDFETTSGTIVDTANAVSQTIDAVAYRCAAIHPNATSGTPVNGALCMWMGADAGLLVTVRTSDPTAAIADVQTTYAALH